MIFVGCFLVITINSLLYFYLKLKKKESYISIFNDKWGIARSRRLMWMYKHGAHYNFYDPEYQELFQLEIGAEARYIICLDSAGVTAGDISWSDYKHEEKKFLLQNE